MKKIILVVVSIPLLLCPFSCRDEVFIYEEVSEQIIPPSSETEKTAGFYLLNEGNMGMNRASIDYFDFSSGNYHRDIYSERNPEIVKELGDVGNDIKIYGDKLYAVINCSNFVEVMDAKTARHLARISIPNCRYLAFNKGKVYVSSYAGKVEINPNAEIGFVAEIDTVSLTLTRKVNVGYQPEQMVIYNNNLYVANSGGYRVPNYDNTVSVIDLNTFQEKKKIDVGINLHRMIVDKQGDIYVNSRGNYYDIPPSLYIIDSETDSVKQKLDIPIGGMYLSGDSLYFYSVAFNYNTGENKVTYGILDTQTKKIVSDKIITDGTESQIVIPYGLAVHPQTKEIYITDAQNYVVTGYVYCFTPEGKFKWRVLAGNIPAHFTFLTQ